MRLIIKDVKIVHRFYTSFIKNFMPMNPNFDLLTQRATHILKSLIAIPSISRNETEAADFLFDYLAKEGANPQRLGNNVWCEQPLQGTHAADTRNEKPTLLLNAHIDTVKPAASWIHNPFQASVENGRIYGLGSNDCGGGLVTLMELFLALRNENLPYHLVFLASAEEEVSGKNGIEAALPHLPHIDVALVGEPTGMQPAIAEKGLMVLDCTAHGRSGHAARNEGINAIYQALPDIEWFRTYHFAQETDLLGPVKMSVTMVNAGTQHNVVPDTCTFVVDVRPNECYTNEEVLEYIRQHVSCDVTPRSTRLHSSRISPTHPLVRAAISQGRTPFGSPTLSDQALMRFPSFKMGPGDSARSHTAEEYVCISELREAIEIYFKMIGS